MSKKKADFATIDNSKHAVFIDKSYAFYRAMNAAYKDENWYSVGLEAVYCAISATNAVLAGKFGIRCTGKDHRDVITLLQDKLGNEAKGQAGTLSRIINMKNQIEYEDRLFTKEEAQEIYKRADRYFNWAKTIISKM